MGSGIFDATGYALNVHTLAPVAVGALIAALGVVVLVRERASAVSMAFCGMAACGAVWLLASFAVSALFCFAALFTDGFLLIQSARMESVGRLAAGGPSAEPGPAKRGMAP